MEESPFVVVADDHPLMRAALAQALGPKARVIEAETLDQTIRAVEASADHLDLALVDLHMPGMGGFTGLVQITALAPSLPVVVVSASEGPEIIRKSLAYGATAFIPKSAPLPRLRADLAAVLEGRAPSTPLPPDDPQATADDVDLAGRLSELTPQQLRVLMLIAQGLLNKQIAFQLDISEATVKAHVTAILRKLNCHSRTQAALIIERLSLTDPSSTVADPATAPPPARD